MLRLLNTRSLYRFPIIKIGSIRRKEDLDTWNIWRKDKNKVNREELFKRMEGLINANVNKWRGQRLPRSALKAEAEKLTMRAFETYDPLKEASLVTHVNTRLLKLHGFVARHGDIAKIPEERFAGMRRFNEAEEYLYYKFNREPNAAEVADYLKISMPEVRRYRKESIKILTEGGASDFSSIKVMDPIKRYAMEAVYYDLKPEEKVVYEYLNGRGGRRKVTSTGEIARLTNMAPSKISRLKKSIAKQLELYL